MLGYDLEFFPEMVDFVWVVSSSKFPIVRSHVFGGDSSSKPQHLSIVQLILCDRLLGTLFCPLSFLFGSLPCLLLTAGRFFGFLLFSFLSQSLIFGSLSRLILATA